MLLEVEKPIPKGWTQLSHHCFVDKQGNPHFRVKSSYKLTTKTVSDKVEYSKKLRERSLQIARDNPQKNHKKTKKWKKNNPEKCAKYQKNLNDLSSECKKLVLKLRRKKNSKQYISNNKKNYEKLKKRRFSARCAEYKHNTCKNVYEKCKCPCHNS